MVDKKMILAVRAAALFVVLSLPLTYRLTNSFLGNTWNSAAGCASTAGVVIHGAVYALITYFLMKGVAKEQRIKAAALAGLLFVILASPQAYAFTGKFLPMLAVGGCPTTVGLVAHGAVFAVASHALMKL